MIRYIKLKNFRSYKNIQFDFCGKNNTPKKLIILYGANGSGKSSLIHVFRTLDNFFATMQIKKALAEYLEKNPNKFKNEDLEKFRESLDIKQIIKSSRTVGATDSTVIELGFELNKRYGVYYIEYNDESIIHERLEYTLTKNKGLYFDIEISSDNLKCKINSTLFSNKSLFDDIVDNVGKFWGKHSFISILMYEQDELSNNFFNSNVNDNLLHVLDYLSKISYHIDNGNRSNGSICSTLPIVNLMQDTITKEDLPKLEDARIYLKKFLSGFYNDIVDLRYSTTQIDEDNYEYELMLKKRLSDTEIEVPFNYESTGTKKLIHLFPIFVAATMPGIVAIDEIDNGIHDRLATNILKNLEPSIEEQLIITTHNLMLLNIHEYKDYFYFIDIDNDGTRTVTTIKDSDVRIQSDYNILTSYLKGMFKGMPWEDGHIDFSEFNKK